MLFLCNDFTCFAGICGALLDGKDNTVLRFAAIAEQQLFYSKVIGAVKADDAPPATPACPHPFQISGRDLGQKSYRNVSFANTQSNEQVQ